MTTPTPPTPLWRTRRFRIAALAGTVVLLALIIILQNLERWDIQFLFWNVRTSIAATIFASMLAGAGLEVLLRLVLRRRKRKRESARLAEHKPEEKTD
ncbi:MAG: hypothetical protein HZA58_09335 [Acidimicrobiia bacterium]|nr:hypothetical protein [Acidimicrobiia bacterium]